MDWCWQNLDLFKGDKGVFMVRKSRKIKQTMDLKLSKQQFMANVSNIYLGDITKKHIQL